VLARRVRTGSPQRPPPPEPEPLAAERPIEEVAEAIAASWSRETAHASESFLATGRPDDRSRGQCGTSALVLQDWLGGALAVANVVRDGEVVGVHYWNRLPGSREVDLTRDQFVRGETLDGPREIDRPPGPPRHGLDAYSALRRRVAALLESARCAHPREPDHPGPPRGAVRRPAISVSDPSWSAPC
jgi:hypothetical protein